MSQLEKGPEGQSNGLDGSRRGEKNEQASKVSQDGVHSIVKQQLFIFNEDDIAKVQRLRLKMITVPLNFLLTASVLIYTAKRFNVRRLIANPLKDQAEIAKNDKYWRFLTYNSLVMGTLGFGAMSFYRSEANKIMLFKKYEKQVNMYMKWRTEREVRDYLRKGVIDEN